MRRVSIKDVAREAGVSTTTVSYVLNEITTQTISSETSRRVREVAKRMGYVPNLNARSLTSRKTNLIGIVIPQTEPGREFMFDNPFYGALLSSLEFNARRNGYHLLLTGPASGQSYIGVARNRGVDGIVIVGSYPSSSLDELHQLSIPVVLIDTYVTDESFHTIGINDRQGGRMATEYLLSRGHRGIAFVSGGISEHGVMRQRFLGYQEALEAAGLQVREERLYTGEVSFQHGMQAARELCSQQDITAVFAAADILGVGVVKGLRQQGRRVPEDVSVMGFDDLDLAQICDPSLTTMRQDIAAKGRQAILTILDALDGKPDKQEWIFPVDLVVRDSVRSIGQPVTAQKHRRPDSGEELNE